MKADGLVTILGEVCVNGKTAGSRSTEHLIFFSQSCQHYVLPAKLAEFPVHVCGLFVTYLFIVTLTTEIVDIGLNVICFIIFQRHPVFLQQ